MNVRNLNVEEIENYIFWWIYLLKLSFIYLFIHFEIKVVIIILREPPLKINSSKTWKPTTLKIAKFFGIFEN